MPRSVIVVAAAPIFVLPDQSRVPLRVAKEGTTLKVLGIDGEWFNVEFQDPEVGRRVGYIQQKYLQNAGLDLQPMDLSVPEVRQAVQPSATPRLAPVSPRSPEPAQTRAHTDNQPEASLGYVMGRTGLTFGTATAPLVGAEVGEMVGPMFSVYSSFDWHRDIAPRYIGELAQIASDLVGVNFTARVPSFTVMGGGKVMAPRGQVRPYALGGFGYSWSKAAIEVNGTDVSGMLSQFGGSNSALSFNNTLFEVGGGIMVPTGRAFIDAGYRFRKFLSTEDVNVSGLYVGSGIRF